jgi:phosphoglycolate phosphatase-like HAD superfamily hydrolase
MNPPLQLLILDLDGTAKVPQFDFFIERTLAVFDHLKLPPVDRAHLVERARNNTLFTVLGEHNTAENREQFWTEYNRGLTEALPKAELIAGTLETLDFCRRKGIQVALATSANLSHGELALHLSETALLNRLSAVTTGYGRNGADKSEQFSEICQRLNIPPEEAATIGDLASDLYDSERANIGTFFGVLSGPVYPDHMRNLIARRKTTVRTQLVRDISEIPKVLLSVGAEKTDRE